NPARRRRRRRRRARRGYGRRRRRRSRRLHRRYRRNGHRRYRRNPGFGMLLSLAKRVIPVLGGFYGARFLVNKLGPMIRGAGSLGGLASPILSVGAVVGANFLCDKVAPLRKHKTEIMLGAGFAALDSIIRAVAPQGVKDMLGMGDDIYSRGLSEYVGVG